MMRRLPSGASIHIVRKSFEYNLLIDVIGSARVDAGLTK